MKPFSGIATTGAIWHELGDKILYANLDIKQNLNKYCNLPNYGTGVDGLLFVFMALGIGEEAYPKYSMHQEGQYYMPKDRQLDIYLKLDYPQIAQAKGVSESLPLMSALFLDSIPTYYPTLNIPDFDWQRFALDVKLLFIRKNWLDRMLTLEEKIQLTQLSKETIELIETTPNEALVGEIIAYCKGLKLKVEDVIPDVLEIEEHLIK